jgi:type I restriction enzyme S subunit
MNVFSNTFTDMRSLGTVDVGSDESQNAIQPGDVLFTVSSETPEEVGMSSVVIEAAPNCYVNSFCAMFRFSEGHQPNLRFLGYSLRQPFARRHLVKRAQGSTRFNLSKPAFRSLPLALPLRSEQQRIADCLTSLDEVIAAQGRKVEALKAHKRGLMQQLFPREGETRPRLRFPEFRDAPEWELKTLSSVCDMQAGKFVSASEISDQPVDGRFPCYGGNGLRGYTSSFTHSGTFPLIGRQGALCGNVQLAEGDFYATEHALVVSPKRGVVVPWLYYTLGKLELNRFATGQAQPGLSVDVLKAVECSVPATELEQQRIADCLTSVDMQIAAESKQLAALKTHNQGLMQQLFPAPDAATA